MYDVIRGDIWEDYDRRPDVFLVVPSNGDVDRFGRAVMGRGLALQVARRFPDVPALFGRMLVEQRPALRPVELPHRLFAFPVKWHWKDRACPALIESSANTLAWWLQHNRAHVVMPCVGCGNGQLSWDIVAPRLERLRPFAAKGRVRVIDTAPIR